MLKTGLAQGGGSEDKVLKGALQDRIRIARVRCARMIIVLVHDIAWIAGGALIKDSMSKEQIKCEGTDHKYEPT